MDYAIIDLGTNTFHLLLVRVTGGKVQEVKRHSEMVRLGKESIDWIHADAISRACKALRSFSWRLKGLPVGSVCLVGTSALRTARNGAAVVEALERETAGHSIEVIDGEKEASLIYQGAQEDFPLTERALLMDVGGGSVECILGTAEKCEEVFSFEVGAQRMSTLFGTADTWSADQQLRLRAHIADKLGALRAAIAAYRPTVLVGTSGTFTTLYDMYCAKKHLDPKVRRAVPYADFRELYTQVLPLTRTQRLSLAGMRSGRADLIVGAILVLDEVSSWVDFQSVVVSQRGLKEGLMRLFLNK